LSDLDYIYSEELIQYFKIKMSNLLLRMVYPTVLSFFITYDKDNVDLYLGNIVQNTVISLLKLRTPKGNNIKSLLRKLIKLWGKSYKIKMRKELIVISTKKCPLCKEMPTLDLKGHYYCDIISIFVERFLNELKNHKNPKQFKYTNFRTKTTKSMGSGDDRCEIIINYDKL